MPRTPLSGAFLSLSPRLVPTVGGAVRPRGALEKWAHLIDFDCALTVYTNEGNEGTSLRRTSRAVCVGPERTQTRRHTTLRCQVAFTIAFPTPVPYPYISCLTTAVISCTVNERIDTMCFCPLLSVGLACARGNKCVSGVNASYIQ